MAAECCNFFSPTVDTAWQEKKNVRMSDPFSHWPTEKQMLKGSAG